MGIRRGCDDFVVVQEIRLETAALHLLKPRDGMVWVGAFRCSLYQFSEGLAVWRDSLT